MRLLSLHVGQIADLQHANVVVQSAIVKHPVEGQLVLNREGLEGDQQADLVNHGGPDKAVCVYPSEHYPYWKNRTGKPFPRAAFGENFTTTGMLEEAITIGDTFRIGTATVQVSQPRAPCYKLAARNQLPLLTLWAQETGLTGFYLRVLEPGAVQANEDFHLLDRPGKSITIAELNHIAYADPKTQDPAATREAIQRFAAENLLATSWRDYFRAMLNQPRHA
jgi:MOSC domain-containing protein YiiM